MMPPGRELDALVAEKVMGWIECDATAKWDRWDYGDPGDDWTQIEEDWCRGSGAPPESHRIVPIPRYSESITDAWAVVEKMGRWHGFDFVVSLTNPAWDNRGERWEAGWYEMDMDGWESRCSSGGNTPAHAICLAALAAVGVDVSG